jgi:hypothetical protein
MLAYRGDLIDSRFSGRFMNIEALRQVVQARLREGRGDS